MIKVVAEAGQCMEGSIDRAILMAEAAAAAGAWGFKIQALDPDLIVTRDASRYWEHGEARSQHATFTRNGVIGHDQWGPVAEACRSLGLKFIATPFDVGAVDKLDALVDAWKIASGDINNARLLREVASTGLPTIVSTGAASMGDVNTAVSALANVDVTLLACSLEYPTPPEHAQLARIRTLTKAPLACEVGYSDHTLGTWAAPLAVAAGATMLEKHFSLGGDLDVPDQGSIFLGTKGAMLLPHIGRPVLLPEKDHDNDHMPRVPGDNHWHQFVEAVLGNGTTAANFNYAGPLTEAVLLGSVATRFPNTTLEWDADKVKFSNEKAANQYVRRSYRKGWNVRGL